MKVLLNTSALTPPLTGIGQYTQQLLAGLIAGGQCELRCFSGRAISVCATMPDLSAAPSTSPSLVSLKRMVRKVPGAYRVRTLISDFFFAREAKNICDEFLYHEPSFILKPFAGLTVASIHDLSWLHYPQFHPKERICYMEREMPKTLRRATHFITDCNYVKNEIVALLGIAPERITAVPLGVSDCFRPRTPEECRLVLASHGLPYAGYLLAVATLEPRKNFEGLLNAFASLPAGLRKRFPLVIVGARGWRSHALSQRLDQLERSGEVRRLGYVRGVELPFLYAGARAFAFPSHYEGFGLPPLEAMASGIPVLVADNSAMAEVVANAGIKVDARDVEAISVGLQRLLVDENFRASAVAEGRMRAQMFTWPRCVESTLAVYRNVCGQ
jgi:alpha-1,3-rhamnosyl/mannosyltransferase